MGRVWRKEAGDAKESMHMREKEKRAEMVLVCFLTGPYLILPGSRKDLRHCHPCGHGTALLALSGGGRRSGCCSTCLYCGAEPEPAPEGCNARRPIRNPSKINLLETNEAQIVHAL